MEPAGRGCGVHRENGTDGGRDATLAGREGGIGRRGGRIGGIDGTADSVGAERRELRESAAVDLQRGGDAADYGGRRRKGR